MDESRTRRMALPSVWPYPRSNGSSATLARLWPSCSTLIALGFSKLVCIQTSSQYPQLVTPVRLVKRLNRDASRFRDGFLEICTERLARIQLNDQGFVDVGAKLITVRHLLEDAFSLVGIHFHPGGHTHLCGQLQGFHNAVLLLRLFAHSHNVTRLHEVGSNVHGLAVHGNRLVRHQLTGFSAGRTETHAVHDVVEAGFQHAVHALDLLLFAQLQTVVRGTGTRGAAVLTRLGVELGLVGDRATGALQEQVRAFTAGEFGLGAEVTCHLSFLCVICRKPLREPPEALARSQAAVGLERLDTTTLLRAAAVVRHWRHVRNRRDADAQGTQCADRRFTARTGTLDFNVKVLDTLIDGSAAGHFRSHLGCEWGGLARTLETLSTGRCPRQGIALAIGDRDDGVVERGVHVCNTVRNVLPDLLANALSCVIGRRLSHDDLSIFISSVQLHPCADPCECEHWYGCADHALADRGDGGSHDSSRCPSNA